MRLVWFRNTVTRRQARRTPSVVSLLAAAGAIGACIAFSVDHGPARSATDQDWAPFVLVAGLLLVGLVADEDRVLSAVGTWMARRAKSAVTLYVSAVATVAVVTALLNLGTSVAFLTPVLVYASRSRGQKVDLLLYGCLLLSNASSVLLPGSNLTNLIVLGHLHISGGHFLARMAPAWAAAVLVTADGVGVAERRTLVGSQRLRIEPERPVLGVGIVAVASVTLVVLLSSSPALPVFGIGLAASAIQMSRRPELRHRVLEALGLPSLIGLFGVAIALGALGRSWSAPATLMSHLNGWGTAFLAACSTVALNNLPAASLLAARVPGHPYSLLVGLDVGPNLFVTGSLAWIIWLRASKGAGARPSIAKCSFLGLLCVPLSVAASEAMLYLTKLL